MSDKFYDRQHTLEVELVSSASLDMNHSVAA